jgi:hypothetical protein
MNDACEIESTIGDPDETQDSEPRGNDSSKSNSITSEHSLHSVGVTASSQVSWVNINEIVCMYTFEHANRNNEQMDGFLLINWFCYKKTEFVE